ncbi:MAG TPA: 30S ribosomal protein S3 [Patescibacteria group bacterium]|nr:30S ribosomal protein S3 [Patescibacteria group bacterium]
MGHKVNPTSLRLNITDTWKSKWFAKAGFRKFLQEDVQIRAYLEKHLKRAGLSRVDIERSRGVVTVIIRTTKPGLIIGKGGAGVEELKKKLMKAVKLKSEVRINIEEVKDINLQAQVIANSIAEQLEKRASFRKLMKQSLEQITNAGARGAKIAIGGRLNGADIARTEHLSTGKIPLHTLRADVDFARSTSHTTYGTIGVKVWIYRGDVFERK